MVGAVLFPQCAQEKKDRNAVDYLPDDDLKGSECPHQKLGIGVTLKRCVNSIGGDYPSGWK